MWGIANPLLLRQWDRLWEATGGRRCALRHAQREVYCWCATAPLPDGKFTLAAGAGRPGRLSCETSCRRAWLVRDVITVAPGHFGAVNLSAVFDEAKLDRGNAVVKQGRWISLGAVAAG
ncbi:MAG: hypothetical protein R2854_15245 [Caldilineaceae bacterium]